MRKYLILLLVVTFVGNVEYCYSQGASDEDLEALVSDSKNDLFAVMAGGLAGAILGLSTLSFVDEPKDHTDNIVTGASLGIIAGVGYVAMSQANRSREMFLEGEEEGLESASYFDTKSRKRWHSAAVSQNSDTYGLPLVSTYLRF